MSKKKKPKHIQRPSYPGGKQAFIRFINEHLEYPKEAVENKIEGTVLLDYQIENDGSIADVKVIHGIGHGCDEEAVRVMKKMKYLKANNKGMKVTTRRKVPIKFNLPKKRRLTTADLKTENAISFSYQYVKEKQKKEKPIKPEPGYNYNIEF